MSILVLAPSLLLLRFPPRDPAPAPRVPRSLGWLERAGQALCLVIPAITASGVVVWWWALAGAGALVGYYALRIRYLTNGRRHKLLYDAVWRVPVPMAILPVVVFLATAGLLSNPWIGAAAIVLAAGHIPIAEITSRSLTATS